MSVIVKNTESQLDLTGVSQVVLAEMANGAAENVERNLKSAVQNAITAGRALIAAKSQCEHGDWLPWMKANLTFSQQKASQYMTIANYHHAGNLDSASSIRDALRMIAESKPENTIRNRNDVDSIASNDGFECTDCEETLDVPSKHCSECGEHFTGDECECSIANSCDDQEVVDAVLENFGDDDGEFEVTTERFDEGSEIVSVTLKDKCKNYFTVSEWESTVVDDDEYESDKTFNKQDTTSIEWARWSWNPITGCKHDCPYCYARDIANRFYPQKFEPSIYPERFACPKNTKVPTDAINDTSYKNVFTGSMADIFGRWVPKDWIELVLETVVESPQWNFLFLTKFPQRVHEFKKLPHNAWMGTSVDCQDRVANAEKAFAKMGGGIKWLSIEPMLTPLKFSRLDLFDWIVVGGASKSSSTPAWVPPLDWVVDLHKQAREAGCAIYYKDNLPLDGDFRLREFPWEERTEKALPDSMKYLNIK